MRSFILDLIDLVWLIAALGCLVWGVILLFSRGGHWKRGLGFVTVGGLLVAARYMGWLWQFIHKCVGV